MGRARASVASIFLRSTWKEWKEWKVVSQQKGEIRSVETAAFFPHQVVGKHNRGTVKTQYDRHQLWR